MSENHNPFQDTKFKGFEFSKSDMTGAKFNAVDLTDSSYWAVLKNAQFTDCDLESCVFNDVNLAGSRYENINLSHASFHNINMSSVSFSGLNLANTEINDANLEGMKINGVLVTDLFEAYEKKASSMREMVLNNIHARFSSVLDIVNSLPPESYTAYLNVAKNKSVGDHIWCIVGARESYSQSLIEGQWAGFSCSLDSTENPTEAVEKLTASVAVFEKAISGIEDWTGEREALLLSLLEHEATHEGQLIRHLLALGESLPASVKWA